ncbi:MAG: hypothetical protein ACTSYL_00605 [Candidatus Thorarchaeota archaeon]
MNRAQSKLTIIAHTIIKTKRIILALVVLAYVVIAPIMTGNATTPMSQDIRANLNNHNVLSDDSTMNITDLWQQVWDSISEDTIHDLTENLSVGFPQRIWHASNNTPSSNLVGAWNWANNTLKSLTAGNLQFQQTTEYKVLYAVKEGIGTAPREAIVLSGVIDSKNCPGANDVGVSVAAVLESARVLQNFSLYCDVYFVLTNQGRGQVDYDYGAGTFVDDLINKGVKIIANIAYDRLLFYRSGYPGGHNIHLRSLLDTDIYQMKNWIPDLMISFSDNYGTGRIQTVQDTGYSERSIVYQMWQRNIPAVFTTQGYYYDPASGSTNDDISYMYYDFSQPKEAVAGALGAIVFIGGIGGGRTILQSVHDTLAPSQSIGADMVISLNAFINVTITWENHTTIQASIIDRDTNEIVYQRTESDNLIYLKYLSTKQGRYEVIVTNMGINGTQMSMNVTYLNDGDGDGCSDNFEVANGLNPYLRDTDQDGLDDNIELAIGSDPLVNDSDHDGASDYDEYIWGSSRTLQDTDGDNITDGMEAKLGTSPIMVDTDQDGISDYEEVYVYHSNPLSKDTDLDGLYDAFEITSGLNPLSKDTDGDSLTDLFEIINHLNPLSNDTDNDGWTDAYEVHHCMIPTTGDTDGDLIPDAWDWDPQQHWINVFAPVSVISTVTLLGIYAWLKRRKYARST